MASVRQRAEETLLAELNPILIISDPNECNENFSIVIKAILDNVYLTETAEYDRTYETISGYALKVLCSNLFRKNCDFCLGKVVSLLASLNEHDPGVTPPDVYLQGQCLKEFLCVLLLLLLKSKNSDEGDLISIDAEVVFHSLRQFKFVGVLTSVISRTMELVQDGFSSYVLLRFSCDIFFEYLYHTVVIDAAEFDQLCQSRLVKVAISQLVDNDQFDNYDIDDGYDSEDQLVAYEQFKSILLINEQCLMAKYDNCVYETLSETSFAAFTNLAIYHLNREESRIVKILILKFLFMIFTGNNVDSCAYTNDLKILVDICIRELNNLEYTAGDSKILVIDYLRVLIPLVENSHMDPYKVDELARVMKSLVTQSQASDCEENVIAMLATKILSLGWFGNGPRSPSDLDPSPISINLVQSLSRVASVRTSTRADYHKQTASHNFDLSRRASQKSATGTTNNGNVFIDVPDYEDENNILDLPSEYLHVKPLPRLPVPARRQQLYASANSSESSVNSASSLVRKALRKKAPPPPSPTPPPPPPPRRRR